MSLNLLIRTFWTESHNLYVKKEAKLETFLISAKTFSENLRNFGQIVQPWMLVLIQDLSQSSKLGDFESQLEARYLKYALHHFISRILIYWTLIYGTNWTFRTCFWQVLEVCKYWGMHNLSQFSRPRQDAYEKAETVANFLNIQWHFGSIW